MKKAAFFALLAGGTVFSICYGIACWVTAGSSFTAAEEEASRFKVKHSSNIALVVLPQKARTMAPSPGDIAWNACNGQRNSPRHNWRLAAVGCPEEYERCGACGACRAPRSAP